MKVSTYRFNEILSNINDTDLSGDVLKYFAELREVCAERDILKEVLAHVYRHVDLGPHLKPDVARVLGLDAPAGKGLTNG